MPGMDATQVPALTNSDAVQEPVDAAIRAAAKSKNTVISGIAASP